MQRPPAETPVYGFVLAGGSGKRFWPLSREMSPKQLLSVFGTRSLVADALYRLSETPGVTPQRIAVLTNERLADELGNTLACSEEPWMRQAEVLVEPLGRDSGPAVALCAAVALESNPDAVIIVMPSNQVVSGTHWPKVAAESLELVREGLLVTLGLPEDHASPDADRLVLGEPISGVARRCVTYRGVASAEARDERVAGAGMAYGDGRGECVAASDVVIASAERFLAAVRRHPLGAVIEETARWVAAQPAGEWTSDEVRDRFSAVAPVSLGAVLAHASDQLAVVPTGDEWQGIGDFRALESFTEPDERGNHRVGRGVDVDSAGCIVFGGSRLVATLGVEDLIVVDTSDATLVCAKDRASDVRLVADMLAERGEPEAIAPKVSLRPWGSWTSLVKGERYQMKMIEVEVGRRVSLQSHVHRSEHWIVVEGVAAVTIDDSVVEVAAGQSVFIPAGAVHRMENIGDVVLRIVEVQVGDYLGEDDIVRYEDDYDRTR